MFWNSFDSFVRFFYERNNPIIPIFFQIIIQKYRLQVNSHVIFCCCYCLWTVEQWNRIWMFDQIAPQSILTENQYQVCVNEYEPNTDWYNANVLNSIDFGGFAVKLNSIQPNCSNSEKISIFIFSRYEDMKNSRFIVSVGNMNAFANFCNIAVYKYTIYINKYWCTKCNSPNRTIKCIPYSLTIWCNRVDPLDCRTI